VRRGLFDERYRRGLKGEAQYAFALAHGQRIE